MKTCSRCKKKKLLLEFYSDKRTNDGLYSSCKECHNKISNRFYVKKGIKTGEENPLWKGDGAGYSAMHKTFPTPMQKPEACENCGGTESRIEWANKSGNYRRENSDWLALCTPCHALFDKRTALTYEQAVELEQKYHTDRGTMRELAKDYGVSLSTVQGIISGRLKAYKENLYYERS